MAPLAANNILTRTVGSEPRFVSEVNRPGKVDGDEWYPIQEVPLVARHANTGWMDGLPLLPDYFRLAMPLSTCRRCSKVGRILR